MGLNARQRAEQFTWDGYGERIAEAYEKVLRAHAKSV